MEPPPLGLYVHLPWCVRKCPYCDFNSHEVRGGMPAEAYLEALVEDLAHDLPLARGRPVSSIYFGGGTPSLFSAAQVAGLLAAFREALVIEAGVEITLEANPGAVEHDRFAAYAEAGVNRVSLGVQSFDDACLASLGRIHGSREAGDAIAALRGSGIAVFNIDLMFGLPGQSPAQAREDVERAADSGATHISHYQLTVEPNTAFAADPPRLPGEESCWRMQEEAAQILEKNGFCQYEVSAWSRDGQECVHNLNYWRYGDFIGIGAGAHGKLTDAGRGVIRRVARQRHPRRYLAGERIAEIRALDGPERTFEYFLNRLRLREGFDAQDYVKRTGLHWDLARPAVQRAVAAGLLEQRGDVYRHTPLGWRFVNDIQALFLPPKGVRAGA